MDLVVQNLDLVEKDYFGLSVKKSSQPMKKEKGKSEEASLEEFPPIVSFNHAPLGPFVKNLYSLVTTLSCVILTGPCFPGSIFLEF